MNRHNFRYGNPLCRGSASGADSKCNFQFSNSVKFLTAFLAMTLPFLSGCSTATERLAARNRIEFPYSKVFYVPYSEVEAAVRQSMIRYPQKIEDTEAGIFETHYVKGENRFQSPLQKEEFSSGYRYRILIRMARGRNEDRNAVKVQVIKQAEISRDFFAAPEKVPSDGLEEEVILYRITRELTIARAIQKAAKK